MNNSNVIKDNHFLQLVKIIASIFIIILHFGYFNKIQIFFSIISRFAVPLFFTISGFYLGTTNDYLLLRKKINNRMKKIFFLILLSFCTYFLYHLIYSIINKTSFVNWLSKNYNISNLIFIFLFNYSNLSIHLWFLYAIFYSYLFIFIFAKQFSNNKAFVKIIASIIPLTYFLRIIFFITKPKLLIFNLDNEVILKNWLFMGLPFICFGNLLSYHNFKYFPSKFSNILLFMGIILSFFEYFLLNKFIENFYCEFYFGSIIIVYSIFSLSLNSYPKLQKIKLLNKNNDISTYIYIFHFLIGEIFINIFSKINFPRYIITLLIIICSSFFSFLFNFFINKIIYYNKERM